jgi:DNA-binding XRE family transcriptional regulator
MTPAQFKSGRNALGLTQIQAGRAFGVNQRTIRKWEGKEGGASSRPVTKLAAAHMGALLRLAEGFDPVTGLRRAQA